MSVSVDLLINALIAGILLGGFYAAVTVGISISFGILDIVNIAHPAFVILGSYIAYIVNQRLGIDPILTAVMVLPAFYALGAAEALLLDRLDASWRTRYLEKPFRRGIYGPQ